MTDKPLHATYADLFEPDSGDGLATLIADLNALYSAPTPPANMQADFEHLLRQRTQSAPNGRATTPSGAIPPPARGALPLTHPDNAPIPLPVRTGTRARLRQLAGIAAAILVFAMVAIVLAQIFGAGGDDDGQQAAPVDATPTGQIAFVSERDGNTEIYLINADGSGLQRLTDNPGFDMSPDWSPDGERIAFVSERDGVAGLYSMAADGSDLQRLSGAPEGDTAPVWASQGIYTPLWSPDGAWIAFGSWNEAGGLDVFAIRPDGTDLRRLTTGMNSSAMSWSPASQALTFHTVETSSPSQIYLVGLDGLEPYNLTSDVEDHGFPDWSPLDTYIAYTTDNLNPRIEIRHRHIPVVGGGVTDTGVSGSMSRWSPDGQWLAYRDIEQQLAVMRIDGSDQRQLTGVSGTVRLFDWSPDSQHLAFLNSSATGQSAPTSPVSLYTVRMDGTEPRLLTDEAMPQVRPAWRPDPSLASSVPTIEPTDVPRSTATPEPTAVAGTLHGTSWWLVSLDGEAVKDDTSITIHFTDTGVHGRLVCNGYTIHMEPTADGTITATSGSAGERWVMTSMGCTTPSLTTEQYNVLANQYLATLTDVSRLEIDGELLLLITADGRILVYESHGAVGGDSTPTVSGDAAIIDAIAALPETERGCGATPFAPEVQGSSRDEARGKTVIGDADLWAQYFTLDDDSPKVIRAGQSIQSYWVMDGPTAAPLTVRFDNLATGASVEPEWGPVLGSGWRTSPWRVIVVFPEPGCWQATVTRGDSVAVLWLDVQPSMDELATPVTTVEQFTSATAPLAPGAGRTITLQVHSDYRLDEGALHDWDVTIHDRTNDAGRQQRHMVAYDADNIPVAWFTRDGDVWCWWQRGWSELGTISSGIVELPMELRIADASLGMLLTPFGVASRYEIDEQRLEGDATITRYALTDAAAIDQQFGISVASAYFEVWQDAGSDLPSRTRMAFVAVDGQEYELYEVSITSDDVYPAAAFDEALFEAQGGAMVSHRFWGWGELPHELSIVLADTQLGGPPTGSERHTITGDGIELQLEVFPSRGGHDSRAMVNLSERSETVEATVTESRAGAVTWLSRPGDRWPIRAVWDDGTYRFDLQGDLRGWTEADLIALVEALSAAALR